MIETQGRSVVGLLERDDEKPCALRRGDLDERDRAICAAVWRFGEEHGYGLSLRVVSRLTGIPLTNVQYRIAGREGKDSFRVGGGLIKNGWLMQGGPSAWFQEKGVASGSIRPGPRFAALEKSRGVAYPLEWSA